MIPIAMYINITILIYSKKGKKASMRIKLRSNKKIYFNFKKIKYRAVKIPINLIYGNTNKIINVTAHNFNDACKSNNDINKSTTSFLYSNYNKQSNPNPNKTASIVRNKLSSFSSINTSSVYQTECKIDKCNSHTKSMSSTILPNNVNKKNISLNNKSILL
jgi:hypothetical protein